MRLLCLYLPRLPIQIARRRRNELCGRPVITLAGDGDDALVSGVSAEASAHGVTVGMFASVARSRCAVAAILPDNAGECLDALEDAAAIVRLRATPTVAIGGRDHLFVDLRGTESRFVDEAAAATRLAGLVRTWTGFDVRAGVADDEAAALSAAHQARRLPIVAATNECAGTTPVLPAPQTPLRATFAWDVAPGAVAVRARLVRMLGALQTVLQARGESFREFSMELTHASGAAATVRLNLTSPVHRTSEILGLLTARTAGDVFEGVNGLQLTLGHLGPDVRIEPLQRLPRRTRAVEAPVRPLQRRLLRAG